MSLLPQGNRDALSAMAPSSQAVVESVLKVIDEFDLYGQVRLTGVSSLKFTYKFTITYQ